MRRGPARGASLAVIAGLVVVATASPTAGAAPIDLSAPLECGPLGTPNAAASARLPAWSAGASEPYIEEAYEQALVQGDQPLTRRAGSAARATGPVRVPVYVHVIHGNGTGNVPDSQVTAQINVLRDSYDGGPVGGAASQYVFDHVTTTRTNNVLWHNMYLNPAAEGEAKAALRQGGARTLNIYIVDAGATLGWSTLPAGYSSSPSLDGVVIDYRTLPGGSMPPYNEGDTATHEVGHWLGLFHTFDPEPDGCQAPGDFVDDTPYEATPAFGCPNGRDTCPAPGADPITNFMDYTDDPCMVEFTQGQVDRMDAMTAQYRNTAPAATAQRLKVAAGAKKRIVLSGSDPDGDAVSFAITDFPNHGKLAGAGANWTYKPSARYSGRDSFTYAAIDTLGTSTGAAVAIKVKGDSKVRLRLRAKNRQPLGKLVVGAGCGNEACRVTAGGQIVVGSAKAKAQSFKFTRVSEKAAKGDRAKLRLRLKGGASRVRSLIDGGARATAKVGVVARDGAGNKKRARISFQVTD